MHDEFYIGWQDRAPSATARRVKAAVLALLAISLLLALLLARLQQTIGPGVFEWGAVKDFRGILVADPHPRLLVPRPGQLGTNTSYSSYLLVKPFKFGLDPAQVQPFQQKSVTVRGTLIYRGPQTMLEVVPESIRLADDQPLSHPPMVLALGHQTLRGEIVDSKCYLGVMNPGQFIPHRACAIRCISGGIPPLLVVRPASGIPLHFLLVSPDGRPVNQQVLEFVAEPVEISGDVEQSGDLLILRADIKTLHRT